jgi:hypothetical protein
VKVLGLIDGPTSVMMLRAPPYSQARYLNPPSSIIFYDVLAVSLFITPMICSGLSNI